MKLQIIQLEPYDDVVSIRDRLRLVDTERTLLVWPTQRRAKLLRHRLDVVLVQREAERQQTRLALVTSEPDILAYAKALNVSTFRSIRAAQHATQWKEPLDKVFIDRSDKPTDEPDHYVLREVASRFRERTPAELRLSRGLRWAALGLLLFTLMVSAILLLPSASVRIYPARSQRQASVQLVADPGVAFVDVERGIIPATLSQLDVETTASIPTTGLADVPNTLASGTVVFTNQTNEEVLVPDGTVIFSTGTKPARFRTLGAITLTAGLGQTANVNIRALDDSAGPKGNVEPNLIINIEGDLRDRVTVYNPNFTEGGTVRQQGIVTEADYDNIVPIARDKILQVALSQFTGRLSATQLVVPNSIAIVATVPEDRTYSAFVGDPVETLTVNLRVRVQAMIIDEQMARVAAIAHVDVPAGWQLDLNSVTYQRGPVRAPDASNRAGIVMFVNADVIATVDVPSLRNQLAGHSLSEAQDVLNRQVLLSPQQPPVVEVWPSLLGRFPLLPLRIDIQVERPN